MAEFITQNITGVQKISFDSEGLLKQIETKIDLHFSGKQWSADQLYRKEKFPLLDFMENDVDLMDHMKKEKIDVSSSA